MKISFKYTTGILLAATGVGAGDLITGGLAGINHGVSLIWACVVGAILKYFLNEGLARYQIATSETLLKGWCRHLHQFFIWVFLIYLIFWSFFVGGALINGAGIAMRNLLGFGDKIYLGIVQSILGLMLVLFGRFQTIERVMSFFVFIMFFAVIMFSFYFLNSPLEIISSGLVPKVSGENLKYVIAILGGVGGTLTILSYSYWIKEKEVSGGNGLKQVKTDLRLSYCLTGLFSISMIILGAQLSSFTGPKSLFPVYISQLYEESFGLVGKYIFLIGFWSGVFSSLLGVWQSVPYIFADLMNSKFKWKNKVKMYRYFAIYIAIVPIISLWIDFERIQLAYAIVGALFMPFLAITLFFMTRRLNSYKSSLLQQIAYLITFFIFICFGYLKLTS